MTIVAAAALQPTMLVVLVTAAALVMVSTGVRGRQVAWQPRRDLLETVRRWRERLRGRGY